MKRSKPSSSPLPEDAPKLRKIGDSPAGGDSENDEALAVLQPFLEELEQIQEAIAELDEECAREQMVTQQKFDQKKKPEIEKRQAVIDKIPHFWGRALRNHPSMMFLVQEDTPILDCLTQVKLDDNLDENGSYKITFVFSEEASKYMSPLVLEKSVTFKREGEQPEDEILKATKILWKNKETNPVAVAMSERSSGEGDSWSIFEWFTEDPDAHLRVDVGELIRREVWHSPGAFFLGEGGEEEDEEDLSDSEDEEDEEE